MSKLQKAIFFGLVTIFVLIIGIPFLIDKMNETQPWNINSAEHLTLTSGEYIVGKDINKGFYDIEVLGNNMNIFGIEVSKRDRFINRFFDNGIHVYIEGEGKVQLRPASFDMLPKNKENYYEIHHTGDYLIGKHLPEGKYTLSYLLKNSKPLDEGSEEPFIQIFDSLDKISPKSFSLKKNDKHEITLKLGNILEVNKGLFKELDHIVITLTPRE